MTHKLDEKKVKNKDFIYKIIKFYNFRFLMTNLRLIYQIYSKKVLILGEKKFIIFRFI